jgi:hypothetical protein
MTQPKYRQSDGQIVNFKPSDDAVPINQEELKTTQATYNETPATTNPGKNVVAQKSLRSQSNFLRFPIDTSNPAYSGKIVFTLYEQEPFEFTDKTKQVASTFKDNVLSNNNKSKVEGEDTETENTNTQLEDDATELGNNVTGDVLSQLGLKKIKAVKPGSHSGRTTTQAELYFPLSITIDDDVQYEGGALNTVGFGAMAGFKAGEGMVGAVTETIGNALGALADFFTLDMATDAGRLAATKYRGKYSFGAEGVQTAVSLTTGLEVNPNMRTLFRGVSVRAFSFTFKMIPRSKKEAEEIASIIKFFRSELYPEIFYVGGGDEDDGPKLPLGYKFPKMFKIGFKHKGSEAKIPQLEYCYLRGVSSTYNPTSGNFMNDGHPNEIDLTLRFQEHRALSRDDVLEGM